MPYLEFSKSATRESERANCDKFHAPTRDCAPSRRQQRATEITLPRGQSHRDTYACSSISK